MIKHLSIALFCFFLSTCLSAQDGAQLFDNSLLHEIHIDFPDSDYWDDLTSNYEDNAVFSGSDIPYVMASITIDGEVVDSVGVRFKAKSAYYYVEDKKPFKIDLNEFVSGKKYDGLKKFNLHNGLGDPGMQRNFLSYNLMRSIGVAAPRVAFAKVYLNGEYWGVYDIIEQIDRTFLDHNFADDSGNLYKNQRWTELEWYGDDPDTYRDTFELKTNVEEDNWDDFINFLDVLNNSSDEDFPIAIQEVFNVDQYLKVLAVDIMTNNWDSYIDNARNFYLYHEPETGRFNWIPWDYNLSLGGRISTSGNPYPPFNTDCIIRTDISHTYDDLEVSFTEHTSPAAEGYLWDFGDGNTSTEQNPVHTYNSEGRYQVCLAVYRLDNNGLCEQKRCVQIDLTVDLNECNTITNGSSPYPANDPIFQLVVADDDYCCNGQWDAVCQVSYLNFQDQNPFEISTGVEYNMNYDLMLNNSDKILIERILSVPAFRDRYLDIVCVLEDQHFNFTSLYPKIEYFGDLLREAIHEDPNYLYTHDYFEYDVGNGTGGGSDARIPALKYFFVQRIPQVQEDIVNYQDDCSNAFTNLNWQDIVINEFVALVDQGDFVDEAGEFEDWIELYNNTADTIYLDRYYLSDAISMPFKWRFPDGSKIAPYDYLLVWADKDLSQGDFHSGFKLSLNGEELLLIHEDGTWLDYYSFDVQLPNLASARVPNGTGDFVIQTVSPGENNDLINTTLDFNNSYNLQLSPNPTDDLLLINLFFSETVKNWSLNIYSTLGEVVYTLPEVYEPQRQLSLKNLGLSPGIYFIEVDIDGAKQTQKLFFFN